MLGLSPTASEPIGAGPQNAGPIFVSADLAGGFSVGALVGADLAASFGLRVLVGADLAATFPVLMLVAANLAGDFLVVGSGFARAPAGSGYPVRSKLSTSRPAAIQRNTR